MADKMRVIVRTDIGQSYARYVAKPAGIKVIDDEVNNEIKGAYPWILKREHGRVLNYLFYDGKYDHELDIDW
jgi:hypothetical protein